MLQAVNANAMEYEDEDNAVLMELANKATDEKLRRMMPKLAQRSGTTCTAICALVSPQSITVSCVGDSRCVLGTRRPEPQTGWEAVALSIDQTCELKEEAARVLKYGGRVAKLGNSWKVVHPHGHALGMSRSLGDLTFDRVAVISDAVVIRHELGPADACVILASDGVWESGVR
jgi:serine/threonine protein phosphatase PrpC